MEHLLQAIRKRTSPKYKETTKHMTNKLKMQRNAKYSGTKTMVMKKGMWFCIFHVQMHEKPRPSETFQAPSPILNISWSNDYKITIGMLITTKTWESDDGRVRSDKCITIKQTIPITLRLLNAKHVRTVAPEVQKTLQSSKVLRNKISSILGATRNLSH